MKTKRIVCGVPVTDEFARRLDKAAGETFLSMADLFRIGAERLLVEYDATGTFIVGRPIALRTPPAAPAKAEEREHPLFGPRAVAEARAQPLRLTTAKGRPRR